VITVVYAAVVIGLPTCEMASHSTQRMQGARV